MAAKGEAWLAEARGKLAGPAITPRELRQLMHAGERLPVKIDEVEELRARIRVRRRHHRPISLSACFPLYA